LKVIQVKPNIISDFTIEDICLYESSALTNLSDPLGSLFDYDYGDGRISTDNAFTAVSLLNYATAGTYTVRQIAKLEECSDTLDLPIIMHPESIADFDVINSSTTEFAVDITNNSTYT